MAAPPLFQKEEVVSDLESGLISQRTLLYLQDHLHTSKNHNFKSWAKLLVFQWEDKNAQKDIIITINQKTKYLVLAK